MRGETCVQKRQRSSKAHWNTSIFPEKEGNNTRMPLVTGFGEARLRFLISLELTFVFLIFASPPA